MPSEAEILAALGSVMDPDLGRDIVSLGFVKDLKLEGARVTFTLELTTPACPMKEMMKAAAESAVRALPGVAGVEVRLTARVRHGAADGGRLELPGICNVVAVASGKGGVGKSTVSANLAVALARLGAKVGLMDADVYGPSIPLIMGAGEEPRESEGGLEPPERHGVKVISMAFFLDGDEAVVWRGPMLHRVVHQFLSDVHWGELDYLVVDLPPGTGDVQISLCQLVKVTGALIVSTPQDMALSVARKAVAMFGRLGVPVLGFIENMSGFVCPSCGHREDVFGAGGARKAAAELGVPFLSEIPFLTGIRAASDAGKPVVAAAPDSPEAALFMEAARALAAQVSIRNAVPADGAKQGRDAAAPETGRASTAQEAAR